MAFMMRIRTSCTKGDVKIEAPHQNAVGSDDTESHETTAKNGTFKFYRTPS